MHKVTSHIELREVCLALVALGMSDMVCLVALVMSDEDTKGVAVRMGSLESVPRRLDRFSDYQKQKKLIFKVL